jgi:tRNA-dependent cyclodipeptide synthase
MLRELPACARCERAVAYSPRRSGAGEGRSSGLFSLAAVTADSQAIIESAEHAVVGVSPGNSRYSPGYLRELLGWLYPRFRRIDVVMPGYEAAYTLVATGCPPADAVRRTRRACGALRNAAQGTLAELGASGAEDRVQTWTRLQARQAYRDSLVRAQAAYENSPSLRAACRSMTAEVLTQAAGRPVTADAAQVDLAVRYVIAEIPLVVDGPGVFGADRTVLVYHRAMGLVSAIRGGGCGLAPGRGQGWAIATRQDREDHDDARGRAAAPAAVPVPAG